MSQISLSTQHTEMKNKNNLKAEKDSDSEKQAHSPKCLSNRSNTMIRNWNVISELEIVPKVK